MYNGTFYRLENFCVGNFADQKDFQQKSVNQTLYLNRLAQILFSNQGYNLQNSQLFASVKAAKTLKNFLAKFSKNLTLQNSRNHKQKSGVSKRRELNIFYWRL